MPLASGDNKRKHLDFIQGIISRMAGTSFLLKGWSITVIAGLFALSASQARPSVLALAIVLTIVFWFLDAYYLRQERLYRKLYNYVRVKDEAEIDFALDASEFRSSTPFFASFFSPTLWPFYISVLCVQFLFLYHLLRT